MEQNPNPLSDRKFYLITAASTALGMGCMFAFLFSLRDIRHDVRLEFSAMTLISFVVGAAIGWGFWAWVRNRVARVK